MESKVAWKGWKMKFSLLDSLEKPGKAGKWNMGIWKAWKSLERLENGILGSLERLENEIQPFG